MKKDELKKSLERAKNILTIKAEEKHEKEQRLKDQAKNSLLPYPLFWITNLGVASGLPRYTSLVILLGIFVLFIPEVTWNSMGIEGKELVLNYPDFIQYFVINSVFPNAMFIFWSIAPFALALNTTLCLIHIHLPEFQNFLSRRNAKLEMSGKLNDMFFAIQLLVLVALYIWMVYGNLRPPSFLGEFIPTKNRFAMVVYHGLQITLVMPIVLAMLTAELRASFVNFIQNSKVDL